MSNLLKKEHGKNICQSFPKMPMFRTVLNNDFIEATFDRK